MSAKLVVDATDVRRTLHTAPDAVSRNAQRPPRGAFERHMLEAIALNEARAPLYASLSGGASHPISRRLIMAERTLLPVARWFDWSARRWERAGIPMLEEIFVPMATAPAFAERGSAIRGANSGARAAALRRTVRRRFREAGFGGAAPALREAIDALSEEPGLDCLVRHLLESAHRLTVLAPGQIRRAEERGMASPHWLLSLLLRLHLWGLGLAEELDARARPLQARGIPILASDLPPIPPGWEIVTTGK